jgi:hypothetical protein
MTTEPNPLVTNRVESLRTMLADGTETIATLTAMRVQLDADLDIARALGSIDGQYLLDSYWLNALAVVLG